MTDAATRSDIADAIEAAEAQLRPERLIELCAAMVDIGSPTGQEATLARDLAARLGSLGLTSKVQDLGGDMANAIGRRPGRGDGSSLLLYAPIDTVSVGDESVDVPWIGPELRDDMTPGATVVDGMVIGLGAQNPKGHGACILAAVEALTAAGVELAGDLVVGFGAGGMPNNRWRHDLADGHGVGCARVVAAARPDAAVIAKTGWAVSWEEVGLTWFEVDVSGSHTYVGSRHLLPYRNAIADAGVVIGELERWFETWAEEHRDGLVAPQGVVAAIEGGWPHTAAFTTALCRFWVDLRLSPRTTPDDAAAAFGAELARIAQRVGAEVSWRQTVAIAGTTTPPDEAIITTTIRAWESLTGRVHEPIVGLSGATDANILRAAGVPTARVGLPKVVRPDRDVDFQFGMNAVDVDDMMRLSQLLVRTAIDYCEVAA
ncbi:MAG: M20 family metallopeptidase [Ilumatobacter sp.]|uniref:M20 family metallopeptidase n=1 Tax=Ilumatobacter sp. TaxID=1967498 RepID=UPI00391D6D19